MVLKTRSASTTNGRLHINSRSFPCQLGHTGRTALKREGDSATPMGSWSPVLVYYRGDRVARPRTKLPVRSIRSRDGWCDDPNDRNYNRPVPLPYPASTESLWRDDHAYDLIVVLDYNFSRRSMYKGSAIFIHLAHDNLRPTAGCLAFCERDLRMVLKLVRPGQLIQIPG